MVKTSNETPCEYERMINILLYMENIYRVKISESCNATSCNSLDKG